MEIPVHKPPVAIDFCPFMNQLNKKYGWNYEDMAGKYTDEGQEHERRKKREWLIENGYADKEHVLDYPANSKVDWPADSSEMRLRGEINRKYYDSGAEKEHELPYQNVWHWLLNHPFQDLRRGGINYLSVLYYLESEDTPDYVKKVLQAIYDEVKDHPAFDGDAVAFHIDW